MHRHRTGSKAKIRVSLGIKRAIGRVRIPAEIHCGILHEREARGQCGLALLVKERLPLLLCHAGNG